MSGADLSRFSPDALKKLRVGSRLAQESAKRARSDFNRFCEYVLRDSDGSRIRQGEIHKSWNLHIEWCWENGVHPGILAPFGVGKTTQCVVGRVAYEVGRNPNIRVKVVCNSDEKAKERVAGIKNLMRTQAYRYVFPGIQILDGKLAKKARKTVKDTAHAFDVVKTSHYAQSIDPTVQAVGVFATSTGGRADLLVFDDVVDERNALLNPALREQVIIKCENSFMTRLVTDGRVIYIGTPYHQADFSHELMKKKAWCVLRQPVSESLAYYEQEVHGWRPGYPMPRLD